MADMILITPTLNEEFHKRLFDTNKQEDYNVRQNIIEQVYRERKTLIFDHEKVGMNELSYWQQRSAAMYDELLRIQ
jgi:hypothetical protein